MVVMKGEPSNLEAALNHATKIEAYEQSLIMQGTISKSPVYTSVSDDDQPRRQSLAVNAVQGTGDDTAVQLRMDELQNLLEQATKGIAALAAQTGAADKGKSGRNIMRGPRTLKGSKDPQISSEELGDRKQWAVTSLGGAYAQGMLAEPLTTKIAWGNIG